MDVDLTSISETAHTTESQQQVSTASIIAEEFDRVNPHDTKSGTTETYKLVGVTKLIGQDNKSSRCIHYAELRPGVDPKDVSIQINSSMDVNCPSSGFGDIVSSFNNNAKLDSNNNISGNEGTWCRFDDDKVTESSLEDATNDKDDESSYILMYTRNNTSSSSMPSEPQAHRDSSNSSIDAKKQHPFFEEAYKIGYKIGKELLLLPHSVACQYAEKHMQSFLHDHFGSNAVVNGMLCILLVVVLVIYQQLHLQPFVIF